MDYLDSLLNETRNTIENDGENGAIWVRHFFYFGIDTISVESLLPRYISNGG